MTYLVDANVLSEPTKPSPSSKVVGLFRRQREKHRCGFILGELCVGILALPCGRKRIQLVQWFEAVVQAID